LSVIGIQSAPESDNIQSPETCRRRNQATGILPVPESGTGRPNSGRNIGGFRPSRSDLDGSGIDPAGSGQNGRDPAIDPAGSGQSGRDPAGSGRIRLLIRPDLAKTAGIRPGYGRIWTDPAIDSAGSGQNGRDPAGAGRIQPLIRPEPEDSGLNPTILAGSGQTFLPESGNGDRTSPDSGDNYQTLIFTFRNFFVRTKHRKIFSRK
jgi:hypothetical protein